ncbi:hypothetical protein [Phycicoccus sp.]|uniref:hypothetical protein n=1 Tax=Phycicoccus sp. TaxID=1902410 RepID=UPI002C67B004|nr:hypothetical protein [Phycicoccus sp.]HMM96807.1 hypothetical protein [Phycicoccus sp.]
MMISIGHDSLMAKKAKTYVNGRRMWGVVGRRMFDPEGREYELASWGADGALIDDLVTREKCDVVEVDCSAPLTWHRGADAQAAWRLVRSSYSEGSGTRLCSRYGDDPEPFVGEVWRSRTGGRSLVVLASD